MNSVGRFGILISVLMLNLNIVLAVPISTESDTIQVKYHLNPIIKTATKIAGAQRDLVASVSLIDSTLLAQGSTSTVFETVKTFVPGLYVTEWGVMGYGVAGSSAGKISLRGMGGGANTHVLILRNGRPDFMGLMGCTIADEFVTEGVESIEVLRGPASFLYGSDATGGVINIVPKRMKDHGFRTTFSGEFGSFRSQKLNAIHSGKTGNLEYVLTAASRKTAGHRNDANSSYRADHLTAHIGYMLNHSNELEWNLSFANIDVNDPGTELNPFMDHWYDIKRWGGDLTFVSKGRLGETNLKLHGNFGQHRFYDGWRSDDRTLGLMIYQNFRPWTGNTVTAGFDYRRYGGQAEDGVQGIDYGSYFITEYAPYFHTQQLFLSRFIASAGLRIEHHELYGGETVPKFGLITHLSRSTSIRLSVAKGFRSPSIRELYFFPPQNVDLKPERLWNAEVGLTQFIGRSFKIEVALFRSEGSNLIRRDNPGFPYKWINSGEFIHTGYELMLDWLPTDGLTLGASWSQLDSGEETMYSPGRKLTAHVAWRVTSFLISADFLYIQDLYGGDHHQNRMDDYGLLNVTIQAPVFRVMRVKLAVKNVLDARYQAMFGYPMPGRYMVCELNYQF